MLKDILLVVLALATLFCLAGLYLLHNEISLLYDMLNDVLQYFKIIHSGVEPSGKA